MKSQPAEERLQSRDIQPTAMRVMILNFMLQQKAAVSLSDLESRFSRSDRTTLYRTLQTFREKGLVHQIFDQSGSSKYALCAEDCSCSYPDDMHLHFYCSNCENTFCFTDQSIPAFDLPSGFTTAHGNFVITGKCSSCSS